MLVTFKATFSTLKNNCEFMFLNQSFSCVAYAELNSLLSEAAALPWGRVYERLDGGGVTEGREWLTPRKSCHWHSGGKGHSAIYTATLGCSARWTESCSPFPALFNSAFPSPPTGLQLLWTEHSVACVYLFPMLFPDRSWFTVRCWILQVGFLCLSFLTCLG